MKKLILSVIILVLLTGINNLNGQTFDSHFSASKSESSEIQMQKMITDPATAYKTVMTSGKMEKQQETTASVYNKVKSPEINWQYTDGASIVSDVKVSVNTQNSFVGWELNYERVSLYKDTPTPLWEKTVISDWDFRVDMTEDGSIMVYEANGLVEVFEPASSTPVWDISFNADVKGVALSPDGSRVYIAAMNYNSTGFTHIFCYTIGTNQPNWETSFEEDAQALVLSGDGSTLVFAQYDSIWAMNTENGAIIFEANSQNQNPPAVSYDGSLIVNGDYSGYVHVYEYDTINNTYYEKWNFHVGGGGTSAWVTGMGISGDGTTIAIGTLVFLAGGDLDGEIYLFNSYSPVPVWVYENTGDLVQSIDLSYDGSIIAAASWGPMNHSKPDFFLFRKNTNEPFFTINSPGSMFYLDISPDGTLCAVGGKAVHARTFGNGGILYNINSDPGGGTVSGAIDLENTDDNSGARIEIPSLNNYFDYSDIDGSYSIQYVPAGTYSVIASKVGYYPVTQENIIVNEGQITDVDFNLQLTGNPPMNLFATKGAGLSVDLLWDPPLEKYYTGFNIFRKLYLEDMFPDEPIGSVPANELTYSDNTALPTKTYYYAVTCIIDGSLQSPYSNIETGWISTG
ncbi:MAG: carboxypeptidase regulatory-like domain-containing protein, partial [Bacteroidales bacterium]|nr:carboxypeptidase regulatory-like domain-containing protein [Bacteroidales bacterium]